MRQFKFFLAALLLVFTVQNDVKAQNTYPPLIQTVSYAGLGTSANNGVVRYCRDCSGTDPCTDSGTGAFAFRVNGAWSCTGGGGAGGSLAVSGGTGLLAETSAGVTAARELESGDGSIVIVNPDGVSGNPDVTVDSSVFARFQTGTADATGNCTPGTFFVRTDTNDAWFCTATNTWTRVATTTGTQTSGDCVEIDANGNHIASGAACGGSGGDSIIVKQATDTIQSDDTLTADDELIVPILANTDYLIEWTLRISGDNTADFKYSFVCPASPTTSQGSKTAITGASAVAMAAHSCATGSTAMTWSAGTVEQLTAFLFIENGANAGDVTFEWAQNTSAAVNTSVQAGSYVRYRVIP